ncbi:MAG: Cupin domain protein [Myxococcaceae bacterium]|nr:Cupin domain protein [Myxococcaceae bacterium]
MANTRIFEAGDMDSWKHWEFSHPSLKQATPGKVMLGERLGLCGMEVSLNFFPPGAAMPFAHKHREHEELYVFLRGRGEFKVDDQLFAVKAGSCVRVPPAGSRAWRCVGDEPLVYMVVQASAAGSVRGISDGSVTEHPVDWSVSGAEFKAASDA